LFDAELIARATRAAVKAGRLIGNSEVNPVVLHCSRHISVHLPELSIVARVMPAHERAMAAAMRELEITRYLYRKHAPVVPPCRTMPRAPFIEDGMAVTLWPYVINQKARDDEDRDLVSRAAFALRHVHDAFADYSGDLPPIREKFEECASLLRQPAALPILAAEDRTFLLRTYEVLVESLAALPADLVPIHGDAQLGNVLFTLSGPLWTDFEAASLGPREWDASGVPHLPAFLSLNPDIFEIMVRLRSLCVVVWCSALAEDPDKREAAEYHLSGSDRW
jgi:aminoglycoside phosphotransferase (APT) family kinase protein